MGNSKKIIMVKLYSIYLLFALIALIIIARVLHIQFVEGDYLREKAKESNYQYISIEANRGNILSADGEFLASSIPVFDIRFDALAMHDSCFNSKVDSLAYCLSSLFKNKSTASYKKILTEARKDGNRYLLLKRKITYNQLKQIRKFPLMSMKSYKSCNKGLIVESKSIREFPYKNLAARTIGFYNDNGDNNVGLEAAYSDYLKGAQGKRLMQRMAGSSWRPVNDENTIDPKNGNDIITTINVNIQDVTEDALFKMVISEDADHGCAIVMEVATGDIIAISNIGKDKKGRYSEVYNYAIGESSEPGSSFKLASVIALIDDGKAKASDLINTHDGRVTFANRVMHDSHKGGYGVITLERAFEVSSNTAISQLVNNNYSNNPNKFVQKIYDMHLNKELGIELPGEGKPRIANPEQKTWSKVSLPWMSIGYEVALTPLQILTLYNAVANDGVMMKPRFVKEIRRDNEIIKKNEPEILKKSIVKNKETIKIVKELLEGVVESGTAGHLNSPYYKIAGKTGTAQIAQSNKGYNKVNYKASFVGYFPSDSPKYSIIVVLNNPSKGTFYGGAIAGPVFKEISDKVFASKLIYTYDYATSQKKAINCTILAKWNDLKQIKKDLKINIYENINNDNSICKLIINDSTNKIIKSEISDKFVPNVMGLGAKDAVFLLETAGIKTIINGKGHVVNQSLEAGQVVKKGMNCKIELG